MEKPERTFGQSTVLDYELAVAAAKSLQSCMTLWDPIDGRPPSSAVPGILQSRTLEWVAIAFSWSIKQIPVSPYWDKQTNK